MGRRLVVCIDGTGNHPSDATEPGHATTNVLRLSEALVQDDEQTANEDPLDCTAAHRTYGLSTEQRSGSRTKIYASSPFESGSLTGRAMISTECKGVMGDMGSAVQSEHISTLVLQYDNR